MAVRWVVFLLMAVILPSCSRATPSIQLSASSKDFTASEGGSSPPDQMVTLKFEGFPGTAVQWTATADQPWLTVSPASGSQGTSGSTSLAIAVNSATQPKAWTGPTSTVGAPA